VVLAAGLLLSSGAILLFQTAVFAIGAFVGLAYSPYGIAFRELLAPRLGPALRRESQSPLRFAQLVGFGFAAVASVGYLAGAPIVGALAAGRMQTATELADLPRTVSDARKAGGKIAYDQFAWFPSEANIPGALRLPRLSGSTFPWDDHILGDAPSKTFHISDHYPIWLELSVREVG